MACEKEKEFPMDAPCIILVRFPQEYVQKARNSLIKNYPIHQIYDGNISGIANSVNMLEGPWPSRLVLAVLYFESRRSAQMWYECTPDIKQFDWLHGVDMVMVPLRTPTGVGKFFVEILDIKFRDEKKFFSEYVPKCAKYMKDKSGDMAVVSTDIKINLRGMWDPDYIIINRFDSSDDFIKAYCSDDYCPIKQLRLDSADSTVVTSQLTSLFTNRKC